MLNFIWFLTLIVAWGILGFLILAFVHPFVAMVYGVISLIILVKFLFGSKKSNTPRRRQYRDKRRN